jgi:hypothetical protein
MKQKTAVVWLEDQIITELDKSPDQKLGLYFMRFIELVNQAKQIEEDQHSQLFKAGQDSMEPGGKCFDQYYSETFKSETKWTKK